MYTDSKLIQNIEYLIEQVNQQPSNAKLISQNIASSVVPAIGANILFRDKFKDYLVKKGVSDSTVGGTPLTSVADLGASIGTGLAGAAAGSLAGSLMKKYQEKKYGIMQQDNRTTGQKATDTALKTARIGTGAATTFLTKAGLAKAGMAIAGTAGGATLAASIPAFLIGSSIVSKVMNKPLNSIQQKIQEKRAQQAQANAPDDD